MTSPRTLGPETFDVLVVGGGIVGAGVARDAALRGYRVALVEQHDLAWGTSSRATRLIHGGLRYLERYDFGLVRTDLRERETLLRIAPHLVFPLPFLLPIYRRGRFYRARVRAGMHLYDLLSRGKSLPGRQRLDREETLRAEPGLDPQGLHGAWRFHDAQAPYMERLVVENVLDAAAHGAAVLTHARVERFLRDEAGRVVGALVSDLASGGRHLEVRARIVVNASGPWLDLRTAEVRRDARPLLRLTKGVHLVTPRGTRGAHVLFARSDGRLFFVIPWLDHTLIGTTDTDITGDPADAAAEADDVAYLVSEAKRAFPGAPFERIHYTWAGVRALVRREGMKEGDVSRQHALFDHEARERVPGLISVVGGKITAYRSIAEDVVDLVGRKLRRRAACETHRRALPGGDLASLPAYVELELGPRASALGLDQAAAEHLGRVYGSLAQGVLDLVQREPALAERICPHHPTIAAQLVWAVEREWAVTLGDALLRRTMLGLEACQALDCARLVAARMGDVLGWDETERAAQAEAYRAEVAPMRRSSVAGCEHPGEPAAALGASGERS